MEKRRPGRGQSQRVREVTRARLLAAAEEMFLSHELAAATVDAIAHEARHTTAAGYSPAGGRPRGRAGTHGIGQLPVRSLSLRRRAGPRDGDLPRRDLTAHRRPIRYQGEH